MGPQCWVAPWEVKGGRWALVVESPPLWSQGSQYLVQDLVSVLGVEIPGYEILDRTLRSGHLGPERKLCGFEVWWFTAWGGV